MLNPQIPSLFNQELSSLILRHGKAAARLYMTIINVSDRRNNSIRTMNVIKKLIGTQGALHPLDD
jgi:hypothetical protein